MVDDEPDAEEIFRQCFRREIRKGDYEFLFAERAAEALAHLTQKGEPSISILLSDINMPEMSGIELLEKAKTLYPSLPVVMISAYGDAATCDRVKALGALSLLEKPVDFKELKTTLSELTPIDPA